MHKKTNNFFINFFLYIYFYNYLYGIIATTILDKKPIFCEADILLQCFLQEMFPAGKYWSPGRPEGVFLQRPHNSPLKILFAHLRDVPIWRTADILIWSPGNVLKWCPGDVLKLRGQTSLEGWFGTSLGISEDVPERISKAVKFGCSKISFNFFLWTYSIDQIHLKAFQPQGVLGIHSNF